MGIPIEVTRLRWAKLTLQGELQHPWQISIGFHRLQPLSKLPPVAFHETIRILLALAAARQYIIEGEDVSNANLYGKIDCEMYMEQ